MIYSGIITQSNQNTCKAQRISLEDSENTKQKHTENTEHSRRSENK